MDLVRSKMEHVDFQIKQYFLEDRIRDALENIHNSGGDCVEIATSILNEVRMSEEGLGNRTKRRKRRRQS